MRTITRRPLLPLCAVAALSALAAGAQAPSPRVAPLVLAGVTVIDGQGGAPRANQTILIRDGRISRIGSRARIATPADAEVLDLSGHYVLPGLIDSHAHLGADRHAIDDYLAFLFNGGITAVRDMAGDSFLYAEMAPQARRSDTATPRLFYSANWAGPSFWDDRRWVGSTQGKPPGEVPWARAITPSSDLRAEAAAAHALGVTGIKVYSDLAPEVLARVVPAAHAQGLKVWSHPVVFPTRPSDVVRAGVDVISHATLFVWEGAQELPTTYHTGAFTDFGPPAPYATVPVSSPAVRRVLDDMKRRGTMLDATVSTIPFSVSSTAAEWGYQLTALARTMGIPVVAGTDRDALRTSDGYPTLFEELEALVAKCGFTPLEAITTATRHGARALGMEREFGTVQVGRMADLMVVAADPTADIRHLRRVTYTIKEGRIHRAAPRK